MPIASSIASSFLSCGLNWGNADVATSRRGTRNVACAVNPVDGSATRRKRSVRRKRSTLRGAGRGAKRRLRGESRSTETRRRKGSVRRKRSILSGAARGAKRRLRLESRLDKTRRRKRSRRRATPNRETPSAISKLKRQNALAQAVAQRQNLLQLRDDARLFRQRGKRKNHFR